MFHIIGTSILTKKDLHYVYPDTATIIWQTILEYHNKKSFSDLSCHQKLDYKLYELISMRIVCCAKPECERRVAAVELLDNLYHNLNEDILVFQRPVTTKYEADMFKEMLVLVQEGFHYEDARWLSVNLFIK